MAYLKTYAPRSHSEMLLTMPPLLPGHGKALQCDAVELAGSVHADLVYIDPPYNQHSYLSNYHIWETLVLNDSPASYGIARKREDCRQRKSAFNSKREAHQAMRTLLQRLQAQHLVLSFNDEGFFTSADIEGMLNEWGYITKMSRPHRRYVGARIGIHNLQGVKVGTVSHVVNREFLFMATKDKRVHSSFEPVNELGAAKLPA
jgi:adenine-specific DNA-methyltransferase